MGLNEVLFIFGLIGFLILFSWVVDVINKWGERECLTEKYKKKRKRQAEIIANGVKEMIEDYIDDLFCCGYGDEIKDCLGCCCIFCELCKNDDKEEHPDSERNVEMPSMVPPLQECVPTATVVAKNLKINTNTLYRVEEGVVTPGGTTIRRRRIEV